MDRARSERVVEESSVGCRQGRNLSATGRALPAGLTPSNISDSGVWNAGQRKLSWVFIDGNPRNLSYAVSGAVGTYTIGGIAVFGTDQATIPGDTQVDITG